MIAMSSPLWWHQHKDLLFPVLVLVARYCILSPAIVDARQSIHSEHVVDVWTRDFVVATYVTQTVHASIKERRFMMTPISHRTWWSFRTVEVLRGTRTPHSDFAPPVLQ